MADRTLYDLLEVSDKASGEAIREAYARLTEAWDTGSELQHANSEAALRDRALKEAFLTLADPRKRAAYDCRLLAQRHAPVTTPVCAPRHVLLLAVLLVTVGGGYYGYDKSKRLAAERAVAEGEARKAADEAQAATERARLENLARLNEEGERQRREAELHRFQYEQSLRERENGKAMERERHSKQPAEARLAANVAAPAVR